MLVLLSGTACADDRENCLMCHRYRGLSRVEMESGRLHLFHVDPDYVESQLGPHARLACTDCHERSEVTVIPHRPTTPVDCTRTCHLADAAGPEVRFSHSNVAAMLDRSVHTPGLLQMVRPSGRPLLGEAQSVCLNCHDEPLFRDVADAISILPALEGRQFDRCDVCHLQQAPVDTSYYLRHIASRLQPQRPTLDLAQACAVCHSDPGVREAHDLRETVGSYIRSFHGKAALLGDRSTANCLSCHVGAGQNVHLMLAADDPESSVHPSRLANSCRSTACHPGADPRIAAAAVHLDLSTAGATLEFLIAAAFIVITLLTFGPWALIVILELLHQMIGRHRPQHGQLRRLTDAVLSDPAGRARLVRFTPSQRAQHWALAALFALLALTGFPMKFADQAWSRTVIGFFGGLGVARIVHHWAGIALMLGFFGHIVYVGWGLYGRLRQERALGRSAGILEGVFKLPMWIGLDDARKAGQLLGYLVFLRPSPPSFGRFSIKEKFEYIGVFWGTVLLGITGAALWGEQIGTHLLSGRILNIAAIAHTYEAFLALIHVGILHMVNVILSPHVFPLSPAMITGQTPAPELAEGHGEMVLDAARALEIDAESELACGGHA